MYGFGSYKSNCIHCKKIAYLDIDDYCAVCIKKLFPELHVA